MANLDDQVSEPAVWAIFEQLALATCLMARGKVSNGQDTPFEGEDQVALLYFDLKPDNGEYLA